MHRFLHLGNQSFLLTIIEIRRIGARQICATKYTRRFILTGVFSIRNLTHRPQR